MSLTFNDGLTSQYKYARPVLKAHGVAGTFYEASNFMLSTDAKYMRFYELDDLYRDGDEVGGMGRDHKDLTASYDPDPAKDLAYKQDQVCGDRQVFKDLGYDPQSFAFPGGAWNSAAASIVSGCGYRSGRLVSGLSPTGPAYVEPIPPTNAFAVRAANTPTGAITLAQLQSSVNAAAAHGGGWVPMVFNNVCNANASDYSTCMSTAKPIADTVLSSFLDWLQTGAPAGTTVRTVRDVMGAPAPPPLPSRPTRVSLTFDDGLRSQYGLRSTLAAHHDPGTFYINSGPVDAGEPGTMTWAQIHGLADDGNEIGGHTVDHVDLTSSSLTYDQKWHEVCDDRARLFAQGFSPSAFAFAFATFNSTAEGIVQACGYQSGRTGGTLSAAGPHYAETIPPKDPYAIRILGTTYNGPITLQAMQDAVNAVTAHGGGWLPLLFHEICYPDDPSFNNCMGGYRPISSVTFDAFLAWMDGLSGQGVAVRTISDVMSASAPVPAVTVTSPAAQSTVTSSRPLITGRADAAGGTVTVSLYAGTYSTGTPAAVLSATGTGDWSVRPATALSPGSYTVQASQSRGGVVGTSPPVTFSVTVDAVAPTVSITTPQQGTVLRTSRPAVEGTGGTALDDSSDVALRLFSGPDTSGSPLQSMVAPVGAGGAWTAQPTPPSDGQYTVQATQSDAAGNTGSSGAVTFTVDTTSPVVTVSSPLDGADLDRTSISASGAAGTGAGDDSSVEVSLYAGTSADGTPISTYSAAVQSGGWDATFSDLAEGSYTLVASQGDAAGNTGNSSAVHITLTTPADTTAPVVTVSSPLDGAALIGTSISAGGAAGTDAGDDTSVTVSLYAGASAAGAPLSTKSAAVQSGSWDATFSDLVGGSYTLVASQGDASGNTGTSSAVHVTLTPTMAITSISPASIVQGGTDKAFTISGTNIPAGATPSVSGTGVTVSGSNRVDSTTVTMTLSAADSATAGSRDVTLSAPGQADFVCSGCLGVSTRPRPTSIDPGVLGQGVNNQTVTLAGTGFDSGTLVTISGSGVTSSVSAVSSTRVTLSLSVDSTAPPGTRDVVVLNPDGGQGICSGCFTVVEAQKITSVSPASIVQGATGMAFTMSGAHIPAGATPSVSGSGVTVSGFNRVDSTTVTMTLSAGDSTAVGARNVVLSAPGQVDAVCLGCLTVKERPRPTSVTPALLGQGAANQTVTVAGTGFVAGVVVTVSGSGVTSSVSAVSPTSVTVRLSVDSTAAPGARDVVVVNPDGGRGTCTGCFKVVEAPKVTSVSPPSVRRNTTTTVTVTGTGFDSSLKASLSGSGISVSGIKVVSSTSFSMTVKVTAKATLGGLSLTLTSNTTKGTTTTANALTITS